MVLPILWYRLRIPRCFVASVVGTGATSETQVGVNDRMALSPDRVPQGLHIGAQTEAARLRSMAQARCPRDAERGRCS
jgi:hypothetical protein